MFNSKLSKNAIVTEPKTFFNPDEMGNHHLVMVVEDDADSRLMLKFMLETWKYQVIEAQDGYEAIDKAQQLNPKLILMDVGLPGMDGFDATRRIRQFAAFDRMPIIYLSGYPCSQAEDVGGNDYLVKPIDAKKLENILNIYIEN